MPNLEELLPFFQQLFVQWSALTLNNAPYAITLALLVWLVTAMGYSISIWFLKMRLQRETKAKVEAVSSLESAQQQVQSLQEQLAAAAAELEQTKQEVAANAERASGLEQKLAFSGKKLAETTAAMLEKFELLDNSPAPAAGDVNGLWQRLDTILGRVGERFLGEQQAKARLQLDVQAERTKLADKDAEIAVLQRRVELQTQKVSELEQAANELQSLQQELETLKQRLLISHDKHRADSVRINELEKSSAAGPTAVNVEPVAVADSRPISPSVAVPEVAVAVAAVVETKPVETVAAAAPVAPSAEPPKAVTEAATVAKAEVVASAAKPASKWKGMFGNAMEKFSKLDEKLGSPSSPKSAGDEAAGPVAEAVERVEAAVDAVENVVAEAVEKVQDKADEVEQAVAEAVAEAKAGGFASKLGGMFGGLKKAQTATAETVADAVEKAEDLVESLPEAAEELVEAAVETAKKPGKFGSLLGKFKK